MIPYPSKKCQCEIDMAIASLIPNVCNQSVAYSKPQAIYGLIFPFGKTGLCCWGSTIFYKRNLIKLSAVLVLIYLVPGADEKKGMKDVLVFLSRSYMGQVCTGLS